MRWAGNSGHMKVMQQPGLAAPVSTRPVRPLFTAAWLGALFVHYEIEPCRLQPFIPFELDVRDGRAFVSLVAFTMRGMRLGALGQAGAWLCRPIATHPFLNVRAYVRHLGEPGICFASEWLTNRLSVMLGPALYSLPYRHAKIRYACQGRELFGDVCASSGRFAYEGEMQAGEPKPCPAGSLDEFLLERYAAFNAGHLRPKCPPAVRRRFRVRHEPWPQFRAVVRVTADSLLRRAMPWWKDAALVGANYSFGVHEVLMSAPERLD